MNLMTRIACVRDYDVGAQRWNQLVAEIRSDFRFRLLSTSFHRSREMIFPYLTAVGGLKLAAQDFAKDFGKLLTLPRKGKGYGNCTLRHPRLRLRRVWHAI